MSVPAKPLFAGSIPARAFFCVATILKAIGSSVRGPAGSQDRYSQTLIDSLPVGGIQLGKLCADGRPRILDLRRRPCSLKRGIDPSGGAD